MRTGVNDLLSQFEVVVECVERLGWVEKVTRVAEPNFGERCFGSQHRVDRRLHLANVVQRVKDSKNVYAGSGCLFYESIGYLGWVRSVANCVSATKQHLNTQVWQRGPQRGQTLPRVFTQKAQRNVVGCSTPGLYREQLRG